MNKIISRELLSEVLGNDVTKIDTEELDGFENVLFITTKPFLPREKLNIYELAFKTRDYFSIMRGMNLDLNQTIEEIFEDANKMAKNQ
jgi:hypothetical protein